MALAPLVVLGVVVIAILAGRTGYPSPIGTPPVPRVSLEDLMSIDPRRTGGVDLAAANLACARGLNGAEAMDETRCLDVLDGWARHVADETTKRRRVFLERPDYYEHSEAKFKMIQLVLTLQQDCGVGYDEGRISAPERTDLGDPSFFRDASAVFLFGALEGARRGTCASLPVLVVSIGRRLGYPLKLAATKGHVFARWDEGPGGERFNIEAAGRGVDFLADEHYRQWPFPLTDREIAAEGFLKSFGPAEELAFCLELRGYCLTANGRHAEAVEALGAASRLRPGSRNLKGLLQRERAMAPQIVEKEGAKRENSG